MGGEDFSYYGQRIPACFFFIGLKPPGATTYPNLHTPRFDFNDEALPHGIALFTALALEQVPELG
jgi:metal-dependent amidase/aminoacylase/carboxypeptidase family protein